MPTAGPIHLGVAPIAWSNNDMLELGGETSLETCLKETRKAGFTGTETGVKFPMDPKVLGPILKKHRLKLISGWFSGELLKRSVKAERERMLAQIDTYKSLGAPAYVYAETTGTVQNVMDAPLSSRPRMAAEDFPAYGRKLTELAEWMADYGVPMTYHHHMGTIVETQREIDLLMANTGEAVGLLLDTGHLAFAGGDIVETTRKHGRRINHVHCKDLRPDVVKTVRQKDQSFLSAVLDGVFTVPGDGYIDFHAFARVLADIGYEGWVVVEAEQDPAKAPPYEYSLMGRRHLTSAFAAAGYPIT
ncbi:MAG: myo-inosose-2 dehydratase [Nitratireductor sp.]|uniref:myo-inosose-2 dehydratase n=1 Tax=Bauldia litoralis TaxID=665467 RepID=UPI0032654440